MKRRSLGQSGREGEYVTGSEGEPVPAAVVAWEQAVHTPGVYDLEVDTSLLSPAQCAAVIGRQLQRVGQHVTAFEKLAAASGSLQSSEAG